MKEHCYEMCVVFSPAIEDKRQASYEMISKMIVDHGGEILGEEDWGMKTFAYPMKKLNHGFYSFYYFKAPPESLAEIANLLKMEEDVLRQMVIKRTIGKDIDLSRFSKKEDALDIPPAPYKPEPLAKAPETVEEPEPEVFEMETTESDEPETQAQDDVEATAEETSVPEMDEESQEEPTPAPEEEEEPEKEGE